MDITRRAFGIQSGMWAAGIGAGGVIPSVLGASAPAEAFDLEAYAHPELRPMVKSLRKMTSASLSATTLPAFRKAGFMFPPLPAPAWEKQSIASSKGAPDVTIYIVNAKPGTARPAILHTHGGGFVGGEAKGGLRTLQEITHALDCVAVSVDYRLAPETRYNGSLEDNYAGLKWLHQHAADIGADPDRIALYGESAGGGHAALLAIAARDRGEIPVSFQALIYPMLDDRTGSTVQKPPYMGAIIWTPENNRFGWNSFLGVEAGGRNVPVAAVPSRTKDLAGLPPTFMAVGSIDLFVDEDVEYARRLLDSGVMTELHVIPGAYHGFDLIPTPTLGKNFHSTLLDAFRRGFDPTGPRPAPGTEAQSAGSTSSAS